MERSLAILGVAACLAIAAGGCGSSSSNSTSATSANGATSGSTSAPATPTTSTSTSTTGDSGGSASGASGGETNANGAPLGSNTSKTGDNSIQTYGSEAGGSDKAAVVSAMRSYLNAFAASDYAKVCAGLASQVRAGLQQFAKVKHSKGNGCESFLPTLLTSSPATAASARKAANGTVTHVRLGGGSAFVLFRPAGGGPLSYFVMKLENGAWKAIGLSTGTPINPTSANYGQ